MKPKTQVQEYTALGNGFYRISDAEARRLAAKSGKRPPPIANVMSVTLDDGRPTDLLRSGVRGMPNAPPRGWVWTVYIPKPIPERDPSSKSPYSSFVLRGIEDALWLPAWSQAAEEEGDKLPKNITRETAPPMPPETRGHAVRFAAALARANRANLDDIWTRASEAEGHGVDPEELGYYVAMQGIASGVRWDDSHEPFDLLIPALEAHAYRTVGGWHLQASTSRQLIVSKMKRRWHGNA